MGLTAQETSQLREALQVAVLKCSERCLYHSAKWAAELLDALPEPDSVEDSSPALSNSQGRYIHPAFSHNVDPAEAALEAKEFNKYLLAKSFFDCREYDRCSAVFLPASVLTVPPEDDDEEDLIAAAMGKGKGKEKDTGEASASAARPFSPLDDRVPEISQKSLFLALYAKYMSGEKQLDEDLEMILGPRDVGGAVNEQMLAVSKYLEDWFAEHTSEDGEVVGSQGFLEYLYGMVLAKEKNETAALEMLLRSVHLFPMNWGCWLEIAGLIQRIEHLNQISPHLPQNIMSFIFHLHTSLELYQQGPNLSQSLDQLLEIFPNASFLLTCQALLAYHSKDLIAAEQHFSQLLSIHPQRLDSLDHYSNILYVLNLRPKLSFLAHLCSSIDRFRPESCVVVGNYYSLVSLHEKAVQYFRRALTLDRTCLSAWTLMGHEYVELKNTHAAIESYRRAVDLNRRDYRAWYGLGQTYEVLEMHAYALWYYKKAAGLRPWDGKMWMAVGSCLQKMDRDRDGIKALKRALLAESYYDSSSASFGGISADRMAHLDPEVLLQIASMYDRLGEEDEAKAYMELCVAQEDGSAAAAAGDSVSIHRDNPPEGSSDGENEAADTTEGAEGTGVTVATSKARMWLARYAMRNEDFALASRLATELCQDGVEVEEAKALIREARSRMELAGEQID